jgi:hypothetical protein
MSVEFIFRLIGMVILSVWGLIGHLPGRLTVAI